MMKNSAANRKYEVVTTTGYARNIDIYVYYI